MTTPTTDRTDDVFDGVIPLTRILRLVQPAWGGENWDEVTAQVSTTPACQAEIAALADELAASPDGLFTEPVTIALDEPCTEPDCDHARYGCRTPADGTGWRVGNGMHRILTTLAAGGTHIRATTRDSVAGDDDLVELVHTLTPRPGTPAAVAAAHEDGHADLEFGIDWLRSFRLDPDTWVEQVAGSGRGHTLTSLYECPHDRTDALVAALVARAADHDWDLHVISVGPYTLDD